MGKLCMFYTYENPTRPFLYYVILKYIQLIKLFKLFIKWPLTRCDENIDLKNEGCSKL